MSAQTIHDAFAPAEAEYRAQVMAHTWGHLAPKQNKTYQGRIVFAIGCFGDDPLNPTAIACDFVDLDASPWFFDAVQDFMQDCKTEAGCVYRFDGTFRNYTFKGTVRKVFEAVSGPAPAKEKP